MEKEPYGKLITEKSNIEAMQAYGEKIKNGVKEHNFMKMVINMKVIGLKIKNMVLVSICFKIMIYIQEIGKIIKKMVMEY